ncbi:MAG: Nickel transport system permease protein NikB [Dehalococcoidia bacterium]|nr:Nickel transport system permease protein NikB [Bacillota bacterium]MBT9143579.1 Nickel transport system permease protein NikB [Bacillota bacterium]
MTFALINLVPGDPVDVFLRVSEIMPTLQVLAEVRAEMGLDKPLHIQYFDWLSKVLQLDFGNSYISKKPVWDEIVYYFPATMQLAIAAMILMLIISLPVGIGSAPYSRKTAPQLPSGGPDPSSNATGFSRNTAGWVTPASLLPPAKALRRPAPVPRFPGHPE